jgi:hypothetical protein
MTGTMAKQKKNQQKDRHAQPRLVFHLSEALLAAFNEYTSTLQPRPADSAVLRLALERYLTEVGYWPPSTGGGK